MGTSIKLQLIVDLAQNSIHIQKQPFRSVLTKSCSENMQQIYGKNPYRSVISIKFCNFIEIALRHGFSPVKLLHTLRKPFYKSNSGGLLLRIA